MQGNVGKKTLEKRGNIWEKRRKTWENWDETCVFGREMFGKGWVKSKSGKNESEDGAKHVVGSCETGRETGCSHQEQ